MSWDNYEISLWTHQGDFVSVLCSSKNRHKYTANSPVWTKNTKGLTSLTMSIPIITLDVLTGKFVDNTLWYNELKQTGNLANEKPVKLIFDKGTKLQKIVLFVITNIEEQRLDSGLANCKVTCSGLPFKWLGKIGYTLTLDSLTALLLEELLTKLGRVYTVTPTINYWLDKVFPNHKDGDTTVWLTFWRYKILMTYSGGDIGTRLSDKIYLDDNILSWKDESDGTVTPVYNTEAIEKQRFISVSNSNKYNITQDIAEEFLVFARYEFLYLDSTNPYKPTAGVVIFYNLMLLDSLYSISYGNNLKGLTKTSLSQDIVTKMYVDPILDDSAASGYISISQASGNKMGLLYLFNFDYFKDSGQLSDVQLLKIDLYLNKIRQYNKDIDIAINNRTIQDNLISLYEVKSKTLEDAISAANESLTQYTNTVDTIKAKINGTQLDEEKEETINSTIALYGVFNDEDGNSLTRYYIPLSRSGISEIVPQNTLLNSYDIAFTVDGTTYQVNAKSTDVDTYDFITKVIFVSSVDCTGAVATITYKYNLLGYYNKIISLLRSTIDSKTKQKTTVDDALKTYEESYDSYDALYDKLAEEKLAYKTEFLNTMKYFIKLGTWDTSLHSVIYLNITKLYPGSSGWDSTSYQTTYYDGDVKSWYYSGDTLEANKKYYSYIKLDGIDVDWNDYYKDINENTSSLKTSYIQFVLVYKLKGEKSYLLKYYYDNALGGLYYLKTSDGIIPVFLLNTTSTFIKDSDADKYEKHFMLLCNSTQIVGRLVITPDTNSLDDIDDTVYGSLPAYWDTDEDGKYLYGIEIPDKNIVNPTSETLIALRRYIIFDLNVVSSTIDVTFESTDGTSTVLLLSYDYIVSQNNKGYYMITIKPTCDCLLTDRGNFVITYKNDKSSQQLYYDALLVLLDSCKPTVTYEVSFSYLAQLAYKRSVNYLQGTCWNDTVGLDLGSIVRITDWSLNLKNVKGIVTLMTIDLDNPLNNSFTISNYKTKFLDLFGRITATTLAMKSNEYSYNRAASAFTSNGTISLTLLQDSLLSGSYTLSSTKDGTVKLTTQGLLISSALLATGGTNKLIFSSQGVISQVYKLTLTSSITSMAQANSTSSNLKTLYAMQQTVLIRPLGINADAITAGHLNAEKINIYSGDQMRFAWDSDGLRAFGSNMSENGILTTDYSSYINYNLDGFYFYKSNVPLLSLSWDGLNISNEEGSILLNGDGLTVYNKPKYDSTTGELNDRSILVNVGKYYADSDTEKANPFYGLNASSEDGGVLLNSNNGLTIYNLLKDDEGNSKKVQAVALGKYDYTYSDDNGKEVTTWLYGLRLFDNSGNPTLIADNEGNLTINGNLSANYITGKIDARHIYVSGAEEDPFSGLGDLPVSLLNVMNNLILATINNPSTTLTDNNCLKYLTNSAITINDDGLSVKSNGAISLTSGASMTILSGGDFSIKSGGKFTVDASNFKITDDGYIRLGGGSSKVDSTPVTHRLISISPLYPSVSRNGSLWAKIPDIYTGCYTVLLKGSIDSYIDVVEGGTYSVSPYIMSKGESGIVANYSLSGIYLVLDAEEDKEIPNTSIKFVINDSNNNSVEYSYALNSIVSGQDDIDIRISFNSYTLLYTGTWTVNISILSSDDLTDCIIGIRDNNNVSINMSTYPGMPGWYKAPIYYLIGDDPSIDIYDDDSENSKLDLLWEGSQAFASTFILSKSRENYKYLLILFGDVFNGHCLMIRLNLSRFMFIMSSTEHTDEQFFFSGSVTNGDNNTIIFAYNLRYYKKGYNSGANCSSSTSASFNPIIVNIYGGSSMSSIYGGSYNSSSTSVSSNVDAELSSIKSRLSVLENTNNLYVDSDGNLCVKQQS